MLDLTWQKSSFSTSDPHGDCIELATGGRGTVLLRESDLPGAVLATGPGVCARLLDRLKSGDPALVRPGTPAPDGAPPPTPGAAPAPAVPRP